MTAKPGTSDQRDPASSQKTADSSSHTGKDSSPLSDTAVAEFLTKSPDFFNRNPELLLDLHIPHDSGKAISLLEKQVTVFRQRQEEMQEQFYEIISNARENDDLFEKTRTVLLELLRCATLPILNTCIEENLKNDFDANASSLVFISDQDFPKDSHLRCLPSTAVRTALGELYQKQRTYCGPLNKVQQELLFGSLPDSDQAIISAAIVPLHLPENSSVRTQYGVPLLLIGSSGENHFNHSLDTLFLDFIGEILAVHLHNIAGMDTAPTASG